MSVTQKLVTKNLNVHSAKQFAESFSEDGANRYYIFFGRHIPYSNNDIIATPDDSIQSSLIDIYNNMIFAKQAQSTDIQYMIPRYDWQSNTVFAEYSHTDGDLYSKNFYTVVDDATEWNVYTCLYNNGNTASTVAPMRVGSSADLNPIFTGDGYTWKYMYTITKTNYEKFATNDYIPITANNDVITGATPGTVEVIKVTSAGAKYDNYIANGVFRTGDIIVSGVNTIYGAPETADTHDDFYQGCVLKITSGAGIDQYRKIVNYAGTGALKLFTLDSAFTTIPAVNDTYEIYPYVFVWGDGSEDSPADGRAIIDSTGNSVLSVEMLSVGEGYRSGESYIGKTPNTALSSITSAYIDVPALVQDDPGFESAVLLPIISPINGHGSDPLIELGGNRVCISVKVTDSEGGLLPTENGFRQIGLIKDPLYNRTILNLQQSNTIGTFTIGEKVHQVNQYKLLGNVATSNTSATITKTDFGKISSTISILNAGSAYNPAVSNTITFDNSGTGGSGAAASVTISANVVTAVTVTNQGTGYITSPSGTLTGSGSNAQFQVSLANPQSPTFNGAFSANDLILINSGTQNQVTSVSSVPYNYQIVLSENAAFTSTNSEVSAFKITGTGYVSSISTGVIELTNTDGIFTTESRIIGVDSSATSIISIANNNGRGITFTTPIQLTKLTGNFSSGSSQFEEDELIRQLSLFTSANVAAVVGYQPRGYLHHADIGIASDDDNLFITNEYGIFNLDINGVRTISGISSDAVLDTVSARQPGDFVKDSGSVLYYENLDSISRGSNKAEVVKIILQF